jgi:hypothetical protein
LCGEQSDQILSIFGSYFKKYKSNPVLRLLLGEAKVMYSSWQRMGWPTFWAIFLQTHLFTLVVSLYRMPRKVDTLFSEK